MITDFLKESSRIKFVVQNEWLLTFQYLPNHGFLIKATLSSASVRQKDTSLLNCRLLHGLRGHLVYTSTQEPLISRRWELYRSSTDRPAVKGFLSRASSCCETTEAEFIITKQHAETSCQHLLFLIILGYSNCHGISCTSRHQGGQITEWKRRICDTTNSCSSLLI